jgi:2-dehydro-3-deoxyphosphogluconate aldolase / (4S)-4-hydroxy-2-oxoglutarate aldolase
LAAHGPVIPVIVIDRLEDAVPMAQALVAGGVKVLEVTLRTPVALRRDGSHCQGCPGGYRRCWYRAQRVDARKRFVTPAASFAVSPGYLK